MKISKSTLESIIREVMTENFMYGGGLGVGHPQTSNAVELTGGRGAPVLGWSEIDEIKEDVTEAVMNVLDDYITTTGDAYEILTVIVKELEDKMAQEGYADNEDELERFMPLQERTRRPKRSSKGRRPKGAPSKKLKTN